LIVGGISKVDRGRCTWDDASEWLANDY
jgi:hypothetical protein